VDDPAGTPVSNKLTLARMFGMLHHVCCGRLTLESGVPVSTTDQTAKTSVYFTPYNGSLVSLYDGTRWKMYSLTERTLALGTLTSGLNYDVFLYDNSGTLTLEATAWTNDTTRATALTTQDGVYVKTGATTRRYLGTFRTTSTTTTEDSGGGVTTVVGGKRFLWNRYNQEWRHINVHDTTDSWASGTSGVIRQARATAGNKVEWVSGDASTPVDAFLLAPYEARGTTTLGAVGLGLDTTTAFSGVWSEFYNANTLTLIGPNTGKYTGQPGLGYHYLSWNEQGFSGTTNAFYGDDGGGSQAGIRAWVKC
jgi:hypothetical protein